ncbi:XRCC4-like factor-domain-containing protein [Phaeosphaeria sp. MPI-PUGE-AT-0046c]|nr:XRCC4-like factor-domain-containing protein [Phaeosphaeria sp. MPI-PUGE-AT-0046c]
MACWRPLELSEQPAGDNIPQLLIKPVFEDESYTIHLTCLSNIWTEEVDLDAIVDRASIQQSPIEVSKHDSAQLAILLDNVKKSLEPSDDTVCRITRSESNDLTLHTTITLPKPLDSLSWKFYLKKRPSIALKNELILPLLVSSHIQHERMNRLIATINNKDKAITRLVDQFDSSNVDLAAAFPVIGGLKTNRRPVKREQAAKYVPALQPFREDTFKQETGQLLDSGFTTLGLFREALSECLAEVPSQLQSVDVGLTWWNGVPDQLVEGRQRSKANKAAPVLKSKQSTAGSSDEETEDEFETHANFKNRKPLPTLTKSSPPDVVPKANANSSEDELTEDEDDLDAPPKSLSQRSCSLVQNPSPRAESRTPEEQPTTSDVQPAGQPKKKGFRIGGKAKQVLASPVQDEQPNEEPPSSQMMGDDVTSPKKPKRTFKIGGKGKGGTNSGLQVLEAVQPMADRTRATQSPSVHFPSSPPAGPAVKEESPEETMHEETAEEKAERRRAELKRKTEEAAKKQAQSKKKRRF